MRLAPPQGTGPARAPEPAGGGGGRDPLLAALPEPAILLDRRGLVLDANGPAFAALPGLAAGRPVALALRSPPVLAALAAALRGGSPPPPVEFGGRTATEPTFAVAARPLAGGRADGAAAALLLRDLTAERRTDALRVDFVADVSHELRTPLASLLSLVDTLQGPARDDPAARARFLGLMKGEAERMTRLVDDLLRLSRLELRAHQPPTETVDLASAIARALEPMAATAPARGATIRAEAPDGPLLALGDRDELGRVVGNLVENAIRHGGGQVTVTLRRDGLFAELAVADDGPGIAPEHLPRLTERFYRADPDRSRAAGGAGLGLAIVKHIVGRHRGRLTIESRPGKGATFRVRLPLAPDGAGQADGSSRAS